MTDMKLGQAAAEASSLDVDFLLAWVNREITDEEYFAGREMFASEAQRLFDLACIPKATSADLTPVVETVVAVVVPEAPEGCEGDLPGICDLFPLSVPTS